MSWNRSARVLVSCAVVAGALTIAGCAKNTEGPALSGEPNEISTTTTAPSASSTTSTTTGAQGQVTTSTTPSISTTTTTAAP
jgi:hypothetical protein